LKSKEQLCWTNDSEHFGLSPLPLEIYGVESSRRANDHLFEPKASLSIWGVMV